MPTPPARLPIVPNPPTPPEIVDPRWILSALGGTIAVAICCAYIAVCALFYHGQWQLVLQPSRTVPKAPDSIGLTFTEVHFGPDTSGQPQLDGWWIPSDSTTAPTALILHDGSGSISDALSNARLLHDAELNVLLFDYRGFGRSGGPHPTQQLMQADAQAALRYLNDIRGIPSSRIIVFGHRLGASVAVTLCASRPEIAALILDQPQGDTEDIVKLDSRSRMVPVGLLFNQIFPLATPLHILTTPKLILADSEAKYPAEVLHAGEPKMTVELGSASDFASVHTAIRRFIDTYLAQPPNILSRTP